MASHRKWLTGLLAFCVVSAAGAGRVHAQPPPSTLVVSITDGKDYPESNEVKLFVTVTDREGRPIKGLKRENFALSETPGGGDPRIIDELVVRTVEEEEAQAAGTPDAGPPPLSIALAIDKSSSMQGVFEQAKQAAAEFVDSRPPDDEIALFAFNESVVRLQDYTKDHAALKASIAALQWGGGTALYEAIHQVATTVKGRGDRRAFVVITDGQNDTQLPRTKGQAIDAAIGAEAPGYMLGYGSTLDSVLGEVAETSGGRYRKRAAGEEIRSLFGDLDELLSNQYTLTYHPEVQGGEDRYKVEVAVQAAEGEGSDTGFVVVAQRTPVPDDTGTVTPTPTEEPPIPNPWGAGPVMLLFTAALLGLLALAVGVAWWRRRPEPYVAPLPEPVAPWPPGPTETDSWSSGGGTETEGIGTGDGQWEATVGTGAVGGANGGKETQALDQGPKTVFLGGSAGTWLEVVRGGRVGQKYQLDADEQKALSIGRKHGSDVLMDDESVSREHAVIRWRDGQFRVFNLSTSNVTLINGQPGHGVALQDGDRITLGRAELVFHQSGVGR